MKKQVVLSLLLLTLTGAIKLHAQNVYKPFKVDLSSGYSSPSSKTGDISGGLNFSLEPKYNITDQIAVGLKGEVALLVSGSSSGNSGQVALLRNTSVTGEYYFTMTKVRPYAGLSLGFYTGTVFDANGKSYTGDSQFGFAPRAGLQFGHFRLGIEYNLVKDSNFLSFKIGTTFGGGRK